MENIVPQNTQENNIPLKRCPKCPENNQWHPATKEFFHYSNRAKDGLQTYCKKCRQIQQTDYLSRPEVQARRQTYYARPDIKEHHSTYNKAYYAHHPEMKEKMREYRNRPDVHEILKEKRKVYYSTPEVYQHAQEYHNNPKVRERYRAYNKIYYRNHRTDIQDRAKRRQITRNSIPEIRERDRNRRKTYYIQPETQAQRQIYYSRPEIHTRYQTHRRNRRAREKDAQGTHTQEQIQEQLKRQKQRCYYCSTKFTKKDGQYISHVDHIVPLSRGGSNDISNLVITCPHCNLTKHTKLLSEWPEGGRLL